MFMTKEEKEEDVNFITNTKYFKDLEQAGLFRCLFY